MLLRIPAPAIRAGLSSLLGRVERTAAILDRRGYAVSPERLAGWCLGGPIPVELLETLVRQNSHRLELREGLVILPQRAGAAAAIATRAREHARASARVWPETLRFVEALLTLCPYVLAVAVAGSLASGGFRETDDVDLNLVVEDGRRHLAYVALNGLGVLHALRHRDKPVDTHTRRPLAPRFMTANLILEHRQLFPLVRRDEDMAFELLTSTPVAGASLWHATVAANQELTEHFPQLAERVATDAVSPRRRLPGWLFPAWLDRPSRGLGEAAWRLMQWTRRDRPEALARVAFVRSTMRPYALFDDR